MTNIGPTHLERFGSLEAIEEAKGLLAESLPAQGLAVLNADDPRTRRMRRRTKARVLTFGLSEDADVRASEVVSHGIDGLSFVLHAEGEQARVRTALIGRHQVMTALAAAATAIGTGMPVREAGEALDILAAGASAATAARLLRRAHPGRQLQRGADLGAGPRWICWRRCRDGGSRCWGRCWSWGAKRKRATGRWEPTAWGGASG